MKLFRLAIVLVILCWMVSAYAITPDDLGGGDVVAMGVCTHAMKQYRCVAVSKNNVLYLVILGPRAPVAIYRVNEFKTQYANDEMTLVWSNLMT